MSGASSPAPCSCCCLLKGLRWTCRNRASFSSYSIAPHLQTAGKSRGGCPALRFTGVPFPFQVPEVSEGRPGPSHFPGGSRPNTPHHSPTPTPPAPPQASSAPMAVPSVRAVMPKSPMGQAGLGVPSQTSSTEPLWSHAHRLASQHSVPPSCPGPRVLLPCQSTQKARPVEGSVQIPGLRPALPPAMWPRAGPTLTLPCGEAF